MANVRGKRNINRTFLKQLIYKLKKTSIKPSSGSFFTQLTNTKASDTFFIILF